MEHQNDQHALEVRNVCWMAVVAILGSLQLLTVVVAIARLFPMTTPAFIRNLFAVNLNDVRPEREIFFYQVFVVSALLIAAVLAVGFYRRINDARYGDGLKSFGGMVALSLVVEFFAAFKWITNPTLAWPKTAFYVALAAGLAAQIFYPELKRIMTTLASRINALAAKATGQWGRGIDFLVLLILAMGLYTPDINKVLARDFDIDQFYHFDGFIMSSSWGWLKGCVLNVDIISQYSVLLPAMVGRASQWMGGFTYAHVDQILMGMTAIYILAAYAFMRFWLKNVFVAAFGILFFVKWHLFHWGVSPIVWMLPGVIPVRYVFDVLILALILKDLEHPALGWRLSASLLCGVAMAYMLDTGVYITAAFGSYLFLLAALDWPIRKKCLRALLEAAFLLGLSLTVWLLLWFWASGPWLWTKIFWQNVTEHIALFLNGWGALPVYDGLKDRNFFAFAMGLIIPVVYVASAMVSVSLVFLKKVSRAWLIVAVIALYGLLLYHYFICRSAVSSYYVVCLPFVLILCFWLNQGLSRLKSKARFAAGVGLFGWALGALLTNTLFVYYPNALNLAGIDWQPEVKFYQKEFRFSKDAALIRQLTKSSDPVALISSFETQILIEADRKPFFYYFPLITSRVMSADVIGGSYLHTRERMDKTLGQLALSKPAYVFVEKRLFNRTVSAELFRLFGTVSMLMDYLNSHYTVAQEGQYLLALRRK